MSIEPAALAAFVVAGIVAKGFAAIGIIFALGVILGVVLTLFVTPKLRGGGDISPGGGGPNDARRRPSPEASWPPSVLWAPIG